MTLDAWLKKTKIRQEDFGKMVGLRQPAVSLILNGRRKPDLKLVAKIEQITKGQVTFRDWVREAAE
jgi:transcriptional regulator with XRE-family HTH domain